jgi:hypothetical protein
VDFLRQTYNGNIGALNAVWRSSYGSFDQLCGVNQVSNAGAANDKNAFLTHIAQKYYDVTVTAVRARDPNHLILGPRFAESVPDAAIPPAAACDALGINYYVGIKPYDPPVKFRDTMTKWYGMTGKPVIVSEHSFESPDTGLPGINGGAYKVATRAERAEGYSNFFRYATESPNVVGLHWYQYADQPVTDRVDRESNGNGLVDEGDAPYYELVGVMHRVNTNVYDYLLAPANAALPAPRLLLPRHGDNLQSSDVTLHWESIEGAVGYNVQISQRPTFPVEHTTSHSNVTGNSLGHTFTNPGRWYWRVQAIGSDKVSPFSAPYPVALLDISSVYMLNDLETAEEASMADAGNGWFGKWSSWPQNAITMQQSSTIGVTQNNYSGEARYSGACMYEPCKAALARFPTGNNLSPHDWSAFDYLAYDVYNPNPNDWMAEVSVFTPAGTGGYFLWDRFFIKGDVQNYFIFDLDKPFHPGSRDHITNFAIELVDPLPNFVIYYDNVRLIDIHDDTTPPDPVTFTATDTGLNGSVDLDWSDHSPSPDVVGYRIYVGANGDCSIGPGLSTPTETVDGAVTLYRARMSTPPAETSGAIRLQPNQEYCFAVTAIDWVGNESAVGQPQLATPTFAYHIFPALPAVYGRVIDVQGNPLSGAQAHLEGSKAYSTETDGQGEYALPPVVGTYSLQVTRNGYRDSLEVADFQVARDTHQQMDVVLRPTTDLVANGDFEGNWQGDWLTVSSSGGTPTQQGSHKRSGQAALRLGGVAAEGTSGVGQTLAVEQICAPLVGLWYKVTGSDSDDTLQVVLDRTGSETHAGQIALTEQDWTYARFPSTGVFTGTLDLEIWTEQNETLPTTVYIDEVTMVPGRCPGLYHTVHLPLVLKNRAP